VEWDDVERKRLTVSFHWRNAGDEEEAERHLQAVALRAEAEGFVARFGRKVLEIRPPVEANKGTAVAKLLEEAGLRRALYAGDDTTDLDAFRTLADADLDVRLLVAVRSAEGPDELLRRADLEVDGPAAMADVLRRL
jgi:trehalose 6-phosphate phosphatase